MRLKEIRKGKKVPHRQMPMGDKAHLPCFKSDRGEDYSTSMSGLQKSPNSSSLEGISSGRGRATQVVFM